MALPLLAIHTIKPFGDSRASQAMHPSYSTLSCLLTYRHLTQTLASNSPAISSYIARCLCLVRYVYLVYVSPFGAPFIGCGLGPCMNCTPSICTRDETYNVETVLNRRLPFLFRDCVLATRLIYLAIFGLAQVTACRNCAPSTPDFNQALLSQGLCPLRT